MRWWINRGYKEKTNINAKIKPEDSARKEEQRKEDEKERKALLIVNDWVIDVTEFQDYHPGGNMLMNTYIGRDVSYLFPGPKARDFSAKELRNPRNHMHSNYALKICEELALGPLVEKTDGFNYNYSNKPLEEFDPNVIFACYEAKPPQKAEPEPEARP